MKTEILSKAELSIDNDLVKILIRDDVHLEEEDIRFIHERKKTLISDRKHVVLLVSGYDSTISKEAREYAARHELSENRLAKAIVVRSFAQKIVGNFYIKVDRPLAPVQLFTCEEEAKKWLATFKQKIPSI